MAGRRRDLGASAGDSKRALGVRECKKRAAGHEWSEEIPAIRAFSLSFFGERIANIENLFTFAVRKCARSRDTFHKMFEPRWWNW